MKTPAFTLNDLIILEASARVIKKYIPRDHNNYNELATAIRRARAVIKRGYLVKVPRN